jgi:hypothetical protein
MNSKVSRKQLETNALKCEALELCLSKKIDDYRKAKSDIAMADRAIDEKYQIIPIETAHAMKSSLKEIDISLKGSNISIPLKKLEELKARIYQTINEQTDYRNTMINRYSNIKNEASSLELYFKALSNQVKELEVSASNNGGVPSEKMIRDLEEAVSESKKTTATISLEIQERYGEIKQRSWTTIQLIIKNESVFPISISNVIFPSDIILRDLINHIEMPANSSNAYDVGIQPIPEGTVPVKIYVNYSRPWDKTEISTSFSKIMSILKNDGMHDRWQRPIDNGLCPQCNNPVKPEWMKCPYCKMELKRL